MERINKINDELEKFSQLVLKSSAKLGGHDMIHYTAGVMTMCILQILPSFKNDSRRPVMEIVPEITQILDMMTQNKFEEYMFNNPDFDDQYYQMLDDLEKKLSDFYTHLESGEIH